MMPRWILGLGLASLIANAAADAPPSPHRPRVVVREGTSYSALPVDWTAPRRLLEGTAGVSSSSVPMEAAKEAAVSADGRWVAFVSSQALVSGAVEGQANVYVRDLAPRGDRGQAALGTIELISVGNETAARGSCGSTDPRLSSVAPSDGPSRAPSISADGRFVAFVSEATNLVWHAACTTPGGTVELRPSAPTGRPQVYVRDRSAKHTTLVSAWRDPATGVRHGDYAAAQMPAISGNGRYVVYVSDASDPAHGLITLGSPKTTTLSDIFMTRLSDMATVRLSTHRTGSTDVEGLAPSTQPVIDATGRHVAFATELVLDSHIDRNLASDVVVVETALDARGELKLGEQAKLYYVSLTPTGYAGNRASNEPSISADGRRVSFTSLASDLADPAAEPADRNAQTDIFVRDLDEQRMRRISLGTGDWFLPAGSPARFRGNPALELRSPSFRSAISGDGTVVLFTTADAYVLFDQVDADFLSERSLDPVKLTYGCRWAAMAGNYSGTRHAVSPEPRYPVDVVATGCLPGIHPDANASEDVFRAQLDTYSLKPMTVDPVSAGDWWPMYRSYEETARRVIFHTPTGEPVEEITYDRHVFFQAVLGDGASFVPGPQALSYDGQTFAFDTLAENLQHPDVAAADEENREYAALLTEIDPYSYLPQDLKVPSNYGLSCLPQSDGNPCELIQEDRNEAIDVYLFTPANPFPLASCATFAAKRPPWAK